MTRMSKKQRCLRMRMDSLPHDVVECILERVPTKSLLRFRAVSKQWKSTIGDPFFQKRQLKQRQQSGDPDVLMVSFALYKPVIGQPPDIESLRTLVLGSSSSVKIPTPWDNIDTLYLASHGSCDGLVCLYEPDRSGFVVNPATRWVRSLPLCQLQQINIDLGVSFLERGCSELGFGKYKFTGTYKPVWLYNSFEYGLENATTCEVFDFSTNAWRYVTPASPYQIVECLEPVCIDGSLHWFTDCQETKVVSFDLHTEAFQVVCKAPFANVHPFKINLCNLDNCLCASEMNWPNQVIWSFNSGNKTWDKMFSIDLEVTSHWRSDQLLALKKFAFSPLALVDGEKEKKNKKKRFLFYLPGISRTLFLHDPETKSNQAVHDAYSIGYPFAALQDMISGVTKKVGF